MRLTTLSSGLARFSAIGHTPSSLDVSPEDRDPEFPLTLDLRRPPARPSVAPSLFEPA